MSEQDLSLLHQTLQRLIGHHKQLLETVRAEREALSLADHKKIEEYAFAKEALIASIRQIEMVRMEQMISFAPSKTLNEVILRFQTLFPQGVEQLRSSLNTLTLLVTRIQTQNEYNKELVFQALTHINQMKKNVLGEAAPETATYSNQGQKMWKGAQSRLLSREA